MLENHDFFFFFDLLDLWSSYRPLLDSILAEKEDESVYFVTII